MRGVCASAAVAACAPLPALADFVAPATPLAVSTPSPFGADACGIVYVGSGRSNAPFEPDVAVNPANPDNVVVVYVQDDYLANVVRVTFDGGKTWKTSQLPGASACLGGQSTVASAPSVTFSADGRIVYVASLNSNNARLPLVIPHAPTSLLVNRSTDGGASWADPVVLKNYDGTTHDVNRITADQRLLRSAYVVTSLASPVTESYGDVVFWHTTDGGSTWSDAHVIQTASGLDDHLTSNQVLALPDGNLANVFVDFHPSNTFGPLAAHAESPVLVTRSLDNGETWSAPVRVGSCCAEMQRIPDGSHLTDNQPSSAVAPDGTLYVAWAITDATRASRIAVARSLDGGQRWQRVADAATSKAELALPTVAVAGDGTVGISYDAVRTDTKPGAPAQADVWLADSRDGGATWRRTQIAGPFEPALDPDGGIGAYQGLRGSGNGFVAAYEMTKPPAVHGASDIFFSSVGFSAQPPVTAGKPAKRKHKRKHRKAKAKHKKAAAKKKHAAKKKAASKKPAGKKRRRKRAA